MNRPTLPQHWSPEQAIAVYEYLQLLSEQLWQHYRADFVDLLGEQVADVIQPSPSDSAQLDLFETMDDDYPLPF